MNEENTQWVSVAEATELAGIHLTTMYDRVKDGAVRSKMSEGSRPMRLVDFDSLCEMMGTEPKRRPAKPKKGKKARRRAKGQRIRAARAVARREEPEVAPEEAVEVEEAPVVEVLSKETAALLKAVSESQWKSSRGDVGKAIQKWKKAGMPDVPLRRCESCGTILSDQ